MYINIDVLVQYFEQCVVVNRAYIGMLLVEGLWRCLSAAPGFPDRNTFPVKKLLAPGPPSFVG